MPYDIRILKSICHASEDDAEKTVYSIDSSKIKGNALAVVWPENAEQLQKLIRYALREKLSLTPRGGGTSLVGGAVPQNSIVVDMSRFSKIKRIDLKEKTATVEAGVILDDLNEVLEKYGFELPIKPGSHAAATIGGMIATNAGGMLSPKFGKIEGWVGGIRVMDGTGKLFDFLGRDAKQFAGTEGCCGIFLEAKIRLNELGKHYSTDFFEFSDISSLMNKVEQLKQDKDIVAVEHINSICAKLAGMKEKEYLLVKYEGTKGNIDALEAEKLWKLRENMYSVLVEEGYEKSDDPLLENNLDKFLDWLKKQEIPCIAHITYGIIHPHFKTEETREKMNNVVKELGGKFVGEHGVGILKKKIAPLGITQRIKDLKLKFDPNNIMNKGKVL